MATLPIEKISARADARAIDQNTVSGLADSIASVGLINPIRVRVAGDGWEVVAGVHRLAAVTSLGLVEIEATIVTDDDLHAELAMIDENLCRAELSPSDRARQTARRKAIYLELHPETAAGVAGAIAKYSATDSLSTASFAAETAIATGKDERTVRRDAERGEKVIDEALHLIRGTPLDTGTYLDKIKKLLPNDQIHAVKRDLAMDRERRKPKRSSATKVADRPLDDEDAKEKQFAGLVSAWNKAGPEVRQRFREEVVDQPVFDRSAA